MFGYLEWSFVFVDFFEVEVIYKGLVYKYFGDVYKEMEDYLKAEGYYEIFLVFFFNVAV